MKRSILVSVLVLLSGAGVAQAHTYLQKFTPADGSTVSAAPTTVVLTFSEVARVTARAKNRTRSGRAQLSG